MIPAAVRKHLHLRRIFWKTPRKDRSLKLCLCYLRAVKTSDAYMDDSIIEKDCPEQIREIIRVQCKLEGLI